MCLSGCCVFFWLFQTMYAYLASLPVLGSMFCSTVSMWETWCSHEPGGGLHAFSTGSSCVVFGRFEVAVGVLVALLTLEARPLRLVPFSTFSGFPPMSS